MFIQSGMIYGFMDLFCVSGENEDGRIKEQKISFLHQEKELPCVPLLSQPPPLSGQRPIGPPRPSDPIRTPSITKRNSSKDTAPSSRVVNPPNNRAPGPPPSLKAPGVVNDECFGYGGHGLPARPQVQIPPGRSFGSSPLFGQTPPTGYLGHTPPTGYPGTPTPTGYLGHTPPTGFPGQIPPVGYRGQTPPIGNSRQTTPVGFHGQQNPALGFMRQTPPIGQHGQNPFMRMFHPNGPPQSQPTTSPKETGFDLLALAAAAGGENKKLPAQAINLEDLEKSFLGDSGECAPPPGIRESSPAPPPGFARMQASPVHPFLENYQRNMMMQQFQNQVFPFLPVGIPLDPRLQLGPVVSPGLQQNLIQQQHLQMQQMQQQHQQQMQQIPGMPGLFGPMIMGPGGGMYLPPIGEQGPPPIPMCSLPGLAHHTQPGVLSSQQQNQTNQFSGNRNQFNEEVNFCKYC